MRFATLANDMAFLFPFTVLTPQSTRTFFPSITAKPRPRDDATIPNTRICLVRRLVILLLIVAGNLCRQLPPGSGACEWCVGSHGCGISSPGAFSPAPVPRPRFFDKGQVTVQRLSLEISPHRPER